MIVDEIYANVKCGRDEVLATVRLSYTRLYNEASCKVIYPSSTKLYMCLPELK